MTASVEAREYHSDQDYRKLDKVEREYHEKFAKERRECNKTRYEANNRSEWGKAQRECREKLDDLTREYRQKLRYERQKLYQD